jgi:hypothetical protein
VTRDAALLSRLRSALRSHEADSRSAEPPAAEELVTILEGERSPEQVRALVDRALEDGEVEELLRLLPDVEAAVADAQGETAASRGVPSSAPLRRRRTWTLSAVAAIAAALVVAAVLVGPLRKPAHPPAEFREARAPRIEPLVERGAALPRSSFTLRWTPGPPGTLYDLEVATADLRVIHEVEALEDNAYTVPEGALAGLRAGDAVLWRVDALLPDAGRLESSTFRVRVE